MNRYQNEENEMSGTKSKLIDLNDHLFMQIERLGDEDLKGDALKEEVERSKAVTSVASKIVDNARLALDAEKARFEHLGEKSALPKMLEST